MFNLKQIREKVILTSEYMYNTVDYIDYIDVHSFEYFLIFYNERKHLIKYMLLHVESQDLTVKLTGMIVSA